MDGFLLDGRFGFLGPRPDAEIQALIDAGWRIERRAQTTTLWIRGALVVRDVAHGWVVGDLFERGSGRDPTPAALASVVGATDQVCDTLVSAFWGRYVAIFPASKTVLRDPSGHLDCLMWNAATAWMAGSDLPATLPAGFLPRELGIDWEAIAAMLTDERAMGARLALNGVIQILPGMSRTLAIKPVDRVVWDPTAFARSPHASYDDARRILIQAIEETLTPEASSAERLLAEISGGLDSAIIASTLVKLGAGEKTRFVHYHVEDLGGDERLFARAVADQIGVELHEVVKPPLRIDPDTLASMPVGAHASNNAMDRHYDESQAELARGFGARRILTGQGGDMVFYQAPSRKIGSELWGRWARQPPTDPPWRQLEDSARWNHCSIWSLLGEAVRDTWRKADGTAPRHPWLATPVGPAKARQISSLINAQAIFHGASLRGRQARLTHPLLHQPMLEATLATPVIDLARGGRGRSLARDAFADRIPSIVKQRRSKGDLTAYYGHMVIRSLPTLRPYLLEGRLAAEGVLDREALASGLDPERMIHEGNHPRLFQIIALEAFVRHWEGRVASLRTEGAGSASLSASQGSTSS